MTTFDELSHRVANASATEDVFGDLGDAATLQRRFREMARVLHPDRFRTSAEKSVAHAAFVRLTDWYAIAEAKVANESYGDRSKLPTTAPRAIVTTARATYVLAAETFAQGDVADLFEATFEDGAAERTAIFKIARHPGDNDLLEREAETLRALFPTTQLEENFFRYLPRCTESIVLRDGSVERRANVLASYRDHLSLREIAAANSRGLDFRDVAWMFKRVLAALGFVHRAGFVHGAVLPPHVLVHPIAHGARLVDWCYAVRAGESVRAIVKEYRALYAPEVLEKRPASAATDIFMAAKTARVLMPSRVPCSIDRFLTSCVAPSARRRPDDAWALHEEWDELLRRLVGEPTYRPLKGARTWVAATGVTTSTKTARTCDAREE